MHPIFPHQYPMVSLWFKVRQYVFDAPYFPHQYYMVRPWSRVRQHFFDAPYFPTSILHGQTMILSKTAFFWCTLFSHTNITWSGIVIGSHSPCFFGLFYGNFSISCLKLTFLENHSKKYLVVLRGRLWRYRCPNDAQMPCWLRLCCESYVYHPQPCNSYS